MIKYKDTQEISDKKSQKNWPANYFLFVSHIFLSDDTFFFFKILLK